MSTTTNAKCLREIYSHYRSRVPTPPPGTPLPLSLPAAHLKAVLRVVGSDLLANAVLVRRDGTLEVRRCHKSSPATNKQTRERWQAVPMVGRLVGNIANKTANSLSSSYIHGSVGSNPSEIMKSTCISSSSSSSSSGKTPRTSLCRREPTHERKGEDLLDSAPDQFF